MTDAQLVTTRRCTACGEDKPESEFSRKTAALLQSKCKACQRAYTKEWYAKNREKQVAAVGRNNERRRKELEKFLDARLRETPCDRCGKHFPPKELTYHSDVTKMVRNAYSREAVLRALERAPVRCGPCVKAAEQADREAEHRRHAAEEAARPWLYERDLLEAVQVPWEEHVVTRISRYDEWIEFTDIQGNYQLRDDAVFWMPRRASIDSYIHLSGSSFNQPCTGGLRYTCRALWAARDQPDKLVGIWLLALSAELQASRNRHRDDKGVCDLVWSLESVLRAHLGEDDYPYWHHAATSLFPGYPELDRYALVTNHSELFDLLLLLVQHARGSGRFVRLVPASAATQVELQRWEGLVTEVREGRFLASLADRTVSHDEVAELSLDDVHPDERERVQVGAVFDRTLTRRDHDGTRELVSTMRFRRPENTST